MIPSDDAKFFDPLGAVSLPEGEQTEPANTNASVDPNFPSNSAATSDQRNGNVKQGSGTLTSGVTIVTEGHGQLPEISSDSPIGNEPLNSAEQVVGNRIVSAAELSDNAQLEESANETYPSAQTDGVEAPSIRRLSELAYDLLCDIDGGGDKSSSTLLANVEDSESEPGRLAEKSTGPSDSQPLSENLSNDDFIPRQSLKEIDNSTECDTSTGEMSEQIAMKQASPEQSPSEQTSLEETSLTCNVNHPP